MAKKNSGIDPTWVDPDDAPELTDEIFARGTFTRNGVEVKRGRPPVERPKRMLSLRVDQDVLEGLRQLGPGWHVRANEALRGLVQAAAKEKQEHQS